MIGLFFLASLVMGWFWTFLFWVGLVLTIWCAYFFRDPTRTTLVGRHYVSSPADGKVMHTDERVPPPELGLGNKPLPCIGIFMNVFDVHVNRTPIPGRVIRKAYHEGQFLNASFDKASSLNERQSYKIATPGGKHVGLVQIAGLVARRIISFVEEGDELSCGQRVGLIRFGSKCDVYLPPGVSPLVVVGQKMTAGETLLAVLEGPQTKKRGSSS